MCGRFSLSTPVEEIARQFHVDATAVPAARYNVAPTQAVPAVRLADGGAGGRELVTLSWGLVPWWAEDSSIGSRMINARAETAATKPAYRAAFRQRRCLIPADGFYEWRPTGGKHKQPYHFHLRGGGLFAFAGLWERWERPGEPPLESCTILTGEPNDLVRPVHDRMPVILPPSAYDEWLDPAVTNANQLAKLLVPFPAELMEAVPVGAAVNDPRHDSKACLLPGRERPEPQLGLFHDE